MKAIAKTDAVMILSKEVLPDETQCLIVPCDSFESYKAMPKLVEFEDKVFGLTGWNSDRGVGYYRSDVNFALGLKKE